MAAQSEAASVKMSPFSTRRLRAVLYSTSERLASWSFLVPARRHGSAMRESRRWSLLNRRSRRMARKNPFNKLAIFDDGYAIHKHELNPFRVLQRLIVRCLIDDASWIEHRNLRIRPHPHSSLILKHGRAPFQPLSRHQRHYLQRSHQIHDFFLAHIVSQHPRKSCLSPRMNFWTSDSGSVAGDHNDGIRHRGAHRLFWN